MAQTINWKLEQMIDNMTTFLHPHLKRYSDNIGERIRKAIEDAYNDGYNKGLDEGWEKGYEDCELDYSEMDN